MKENTYIDRIKKRIEKHFELPYSFSGIHGCSDYCFENIAFSIGFSQRDISDDEIIRFYEFYLDKISTGDKIAGSDFTKTMLLNGLLFAGRKLNRCDEAVINAFHERLSRVYSFAISGAEIFYNNEERKKIKSVPKVWRDAPVVRYEHTNPYIKLPYVYDLLGYSVMYGKNEKTDNMIDKIIEYASSTKYQEEVKNGYGIGINGENGFVKSNYYAVGWDLGVLRLTHRQRLLIMILLSGISSAVKTDWYQMEKEELIKAVDTDDRVILDEICSSIRKTYWTGGCYLDFGRGKDEKKTNMEQIIRPL